MVVAQEGNELGRVDVAGELAGGVDFIAVDACVVSVAASRGRSLICSVLEG